ncbi:2-oxoacid:ferredoxin oxidoreductase subunit beta [Infirmifilum lucidum]|uniref:2-oxoacid oxidoreductase (ferredoxin) n=1 Tax=Infirmifilum lucidum TaxID=2776706 RepID=A0A7L9FKH3_9CREN|nr:thiamine pyrophosphate-dependent enzyme [Infirmifilum lucidum]QOJ79444.1 2-oxoacid:ferredoxin oxidoreductase subunit beta [Infirmifilum lucidum]
MSIEVYDTGRRPVWCPGCGNFGILLALRKALAELKLKPEEVVIVTGIGCHGRMSDYMRTNAFHTIHGRVLPLATGIKLANPELTVIGHAGDGDAYAIGLGHLPHAARRNVDLTFIVHNNMVFGLTTGQVTPTTPRGVKTKSTPFGNPEQPLNPVLLALASGATFVARGFSGDVEHLKELIKAGIQHKGFAFIDVLQPCVTFFNTYQMLREKVYKLEEAGHDPSDLESALRLAMLQDGRIPIGIFYKTQAPTFEEAFSHAMNPPPARRTPKPVDLSRALKRFK